MLSPLLYRLTVLQASPQDTGNYSCRVEEWLPSPQKEWYRLTEEESAPIGIRVLDTSKFFKFSGEGVTRLILAVWKKNQSLMGDC